MKKWDYENEQWTQLPFHIKHLPLFTRHLDFFSIFVRTVWSIFLKTIFFRFYIRLKVIGDFHLIHKHHPRLLVISNHTSHLDALSIAASIPYRYWLNLYMAAAKDYFFSNPLTTYFSQHCLGAIPIDRKDRKGEAIALCTTLLTKLDEIWLIIFPEGTRSKDGFIQEFKRGVSVFAERTKTPILFLYLEGSGDLWPKGAPFAKPGKLIVHIGPVHPPASIDVINVHYRNWVLGINPDAYGTADLMADKEESDILDPDVE
jgi:1-acyl-sn-glycerol-3-phosphate acyltransferase